MFCHVFSSFHSSTLSKCDGYSQRSHLETVLKRQAPTQCQMLVYTVDYYSQSTPCKISLFGAIVGLEGAGVWIVEVGVGWEVEVDLEGWS
jgi:hypothetical protein